MIAYTICAIIIFILGYPLDFLTKWDWQLVTPANGNIYMAITILNDLFWNPYYISKSQVLLHLALV